MYSDAYGSIIEEYISFIFRHKTNPIKTPANVIKQGLQK